MKAPPKMPVARPGRDGEGQARQGHFPLRLWARRVRAIAPRHRFDLPTQRCTPGPSHRANEVINPAVSACCSQPETRPAVVVMLKPALNMGRSRVHVLRCLS